MKDDKDLTNILEDNEDGLGWVAWPSRAAALEDMLAQEKSNPIERHSPQSLKAPTNDK